MQTLGRRHQHRQQMQHAVQTTTHKLIAKCAQATHQAQHARQTLAQFNVQVQRQQTMQHAVRATHNPTRKYVVATQQTQHVRTHPAQHAVATVEQHVAAAQAAVVEDVDNNILINQNY